MKAFLKVKTLQDLWRVYNDTYFEGKLTEIPIRLTRSKKYYGYFHQTENSGNSVIRISGSLNKDYDTLKDTLLHEMIHQYLYETTGDLDKEHGEKFNSLIIKLRLQEENQYGLPGYILVDCERTNSSRDELFRHEAETSGSSDPAKTSDTASNRGSSS